MTACSVPQCEGAVKVKAAGLCGKHYKRMRRTGTTDGATAEVRFFGHLTETPTGCWAWDKPDPKTGYGQFWDDNVKWLPHRWAYEFLRTEIPPGLVLDHSCRNPACANPWHLEPVTQKINLHRSDNFIAHKAAQTECIHGHAFDEANTYIDKRGHRSCKACRRAADTRRYQSRRLVGANQGS